MTDDETQALARDIRHLLVHAIRAALVPSEAAAAVERRDALRFHAAVRSRAHPDRLEALRIDGLWTLAVEEAETADLDREPLAVSRQLPALSPLTLGDLVAPGLALPDIENRIRLSAATG